MKSNISAAALDEFTIDDIAKMDIAELSRLHTEIRDTAKLWRDRQTKFIDALELRFGARAIALLTADKKDTGTIHFAEEKFDVARVTKKNVAYDQSVMVNLYNRIVAAGENPGIYMKAEYSVNEAAYKDWPDNVKAEFDTARTIKPGRPEFTFTPKDKK